jgi:hypothetical protein
MDQQCREDTFFERLLSWVLVLGKASQKNWLCRPSMLENPRARPKRQSNYHFGQSSVRDGGAPRASWGMTRGSSDLPPIPGLSTLLDKADLLDRLSDATRCCAELGVKKLMKLHIEPGGGGGMLVI